MVGQHHLAELVAMTIVAIKFKYNLNIPSSVLINDQYFATHHLPTPGSKFQ